MVLKWSEDKFRACTARVRIPNFQLRFKQFLGLHITVHKKLSAATLEISGATAWNLTVLRLSPISLIQESQRLHWFKR